MKDKVVDSHDAQTKSPTWLSNFQLELGERSNRGPAQSRSWISSIVLHLILLLVIALIFAPSDFGGSERHEIVLRFRSDDGVGVTHGDELDLEIEPEPIQEETEPIVAEQVITVATSGADGGGSKSEGELGPRGTFFGIEASGHQIVYVVDVSGSMHQKRLKRAIDELVRSVEELDENQSFYIFLFSNTTRLLFDDLVAKPISATHANKVRVREWLDNITTTGGTDPREALARAIRLSPSAIFMLSDGKFDLPEKCKTSLISGKSDAFDIVAGAIVKPPVHAIAFEDVDSCENMKRLARLSAGQYRFVGNQDNEAASDLLARAKKEINQGNHQLGLLRVRRVAKEFRETEAGWEAREMVADIHHENALVYLELGDSVKAREEFTLMVALDPKGVVTGEKQQSLMMKLINQARDSKDDTDRDELLALFADLVLRHDNRTHESAMDRVQPFVKVQLDSVNRLAKKGRSVEAIEKLFALRHSVAKGELMEQIAASETKVALQVLSDLPTLRRAQGDRQYSEILQRLSMRCSDLEVKKKAGIALQEIASEREGKYSVLDQPQQIKVAQTNRAFATNNARANSFIKNNVPNANVATRQSNGVSQAGRIADASNKDDVELEALQSYLSVLRSRRTSTPEQYQRNMKAVIEKFPDTFSARQAKSQLRTIND